MTVELDDVSFAVVRRGYDRAQVDENLTRLGDQIESARTARDAALEQAHALGRQLDASRGETQTARSTTAELRAELNRLRAHVAELSTIPSTVDGMSERLQQMVRLAQDEVNDLRSRATTGATHVLTLAQAEADELKERSLAERSEFEAERRHAEEALRAQLQESRERLDQLRSDSDGQRARLDAELAEHRAAVEAEFAAEMETRRSALTSELSALEARQRAEAVRIVELASNDARSKLASATAEAQRIQAEAREEVGAAQRELEDARALQHQVSEQLTSVRALLDWTLPQMGVRPAEPAVQAGPSGPAVPAAREAEVGSAAPSEPGSGADEPVAARPTPAARNHQPGPPTVRVVSSR